MKDLISSVRVEHGPGHDHVHVWNRGGKAGILVVNKGEGDQIAARLLDSYEPTLREFRAWLDAKPGISWKATIADVDSYLQDASGVNDE